MDDTAVAQGLVLSLCPASSQQPYSSTHTTCLQTAQLADKVKETSLSLLLPESSFVRISKTSERKNSFFDWVTDQQRGWVGQVSQTFGSHVSVVLYCFGNRATEEREQTRDLFRPKRPIWSSTQTMRPPVRVGGPGGWFSWWSKCHKVTK